MATPLYQVDAFTDHAFAGNPAAVALLDGEREAAWMQAVAAEMNLAETAFLVASGRGRYGLRWFTPTVEVDLCGHATLASAHVLWTEGRDDADALTFETRSGELRARRSGEGQIELDFPALRAVDGPLPDPLLQALAVRPVRTGETDGGWALVEVATAAEVRDARPDLLTLGRVSDLGVILTAPGDGGADIVSRVFVPAAGIPEDPVTGSAHCVLATWWWDRVGKDRIQAEQASARGGRLDVVLQEDRVLLRGQAVTTLRGELLA